MTKRRAVPESLAESDLLAVASQIRRRGKWAPFRLADITAR